MSREEFVSQIAPLVQKYAPEYGIEACSAVIAQAINESGWGESTLAARYHNYFGLKCGTKWTGQSVNLTTQEEYVAGTLDTITDDFRVYGSMEEGVKGYFEFIQLARYSNLRGIKDPRTYLQTIHDDGYATSSSYVDACMALVDQYDLTKYDRREEADMAIYISQASHDENGRYVGGQAGNQTGTELNTRQLWNNNWLYLIVWNDAKAAQVCATAAAQAASNMHIGYDQGERNTILSAAEAVGFAMASISTNCECDCTSLASVCAIAAGAAKAIMYEGGNLAYTGNIVDRMKRTGLVTVHQGLSYSQIQSKAKLGSILVSSGHAVIVTSGAAAGVGSSTTSTVASGSIEELARAIWTGRITATGEERRALLGDKYDAVQAKIQELYYGGAPAPSTPTASQGGTIHSGRYKVICSSLNVRSAPTTSAEIVAGYSRGEFINSIASDTVAADGYTWAHYTAYSGATRYVAIGTTDGTEKYLAEC